MTYKQLYLHARNVLQAYDEQCDSAFEAAQLLEALGYERSALLTHGDKLATTQQCEKLAAMLDRRVCGEPLQYILGEWEFFGLPFAVGKGVLIPRADTEVIVEQCLKFLDGNTAPKIVDLCSGSGAIAIALACNTANSQVIAVEFSDDALMYLKQNAACHCADKNFDIMRADVLSPQLYENFANCDLVVSNPPYITAADMLQLSPEVMHEPQMALAGGDDGLKFYRYIAHHAKNCLKQGGALVFEIGYDQGQTVPQILLENGYKNITCTKDYAGIPRVVQGYV